MDLTDVLSDLYLRAPSEFVAVRKARVRTAREGGDVELARRIGRLPKPSAAAWLINLLVARRTAEVDDVIGLGTLIRDAEKNMDAGELRQLGKQRLQLIRALAMKGKDLAHEAGQQVSAAAMVEVEQTLHAAMSDPAAAEAVRSARLVRSLFSNGIEPVDIEDAVAESAVATVRQPRPALRVVENPPSARQLADAEQKAEEARSRADEADAERAAIREERAALAERRAGLRRERQEAVDRLSRLEDELASAEREDDALSRAAASADHRADVAVRASERAADRLRSLGKG
jgi:hypothetical protein